jgi:uncharacterized repeat protein (TIGR01451 family)
MRINNQAIIAFCIFVIFSFTTLTAQTFERLNGPPGGGSRVYEGRNGLLFQFMDLQGTKVLYRSANDGQSWDMLPTPPGNIWYNPASIGLDGNLFSIRSSKIYISTDNGNSWIAITAPKTSITTAYSLTDGTILIGSGNSTYWSTDLGKTWHASNGIAFDYYFYNEVSGQTYGINDKLLYKSLDKGQTWEQMLETDFGYGEKNMLFASDGTIFVAGNEFIWRFNKDGIIQKVLDPFPGSNREVNIAITPSGRLFASKWYRFSYSDDNGNTWKDNSLVQSDKSVFAALSTTKKGALFGVKYYGGSLFRSEDDGKHWTFSAEGIYNSLQTEMAFLSSTNILSLTIDGLFKSIDGGLSWTFIQKSSGDPNVYSKNHLVVSGDAFYLLNYDSLYYFKNLNAIPESYVVPWGFVIEEGKIFINPKTGTLFYSDYFSDLYKSNDQGKTWTGSKTDNVHNFLAFGDGSLIISTFNVIYKSVDDGDQWNAVFESPTSGFNGSEAIVGSSFSGAYVIYINNDYEVLSTVDYGNTWISVPVQQNSNNIYPDNLSVSNNYGYLYIPGFRNNIYRSVDLGQSFSIIEANIQEISGLAISPDQFLYVMTPGLGLYRSKTATTSIKVIKGNVFEDNDFDCDKGLSEPGIVRQKVVADNGVNKTYGFSNGNGDYFLPVESGNYKVSASTDNPYWLNCIKNYDASQFSQEDTLNLGMSVITSCPFMNVDIQASILRRCFNSSIYVYYSNTGTATAEDAYVEVLLDPYFEYVTASKTLTSQTGNLLRFNLGDVKQSQSGSFEIIVLVSCKAELGQIHCAEAHIYPDSSCIQTLTAHIETEANCLGDSIQMIIKNTGKASMKSVRDWQIIDQSKSGPQLDYIAFGNYYLDAGAQYTKTIPTKLKVILRAQQDQSYPYNKYSTTEIVSCQNQGDFRISNLDEEEPYISKFCIANRGSFDPNDIIGYPIGISDNHNIDEQQEIEYIIRFQNTGTDTAFTVRIENPVPAKQLDLSSLQLGASSHPYEFILDVKGNLIFTFKNIQLPDSSINESQSHGFVQYSIKPLAGLNKGTKILNDARIFFDFNEPVPTNVDFHTIGIPLQVGTDNNNNKQTISFDLIPNPSHGNTNLIIHAPDTPENYNVSCIDLHSHEMWHSMLNSRILKLPDTDLEPGIYFLMLWNAKHELICTKKLVIE